MTAHCAGAPAGFSFADDQAAFARNQEDVARDLYSALTQFFTAFEMFQGNEFYVTGESYAGESPWRDVVGVPAGDTGSGWETRHLATSSRCFVLDYLVLS